MRFAARANERAYRDRVMLRAVVVVLALAVATSARAQSPWLDEGAALPAPSSETTDGDPPPTRLLLAAMLGNRGDQGGLVPSGYRIVAIAGGVVGPVNLTLAIDQQLGADNRIEGTENDPATFSEWVASARVGWRFGIGPDFWIATGVGLARVDTSVRRLATMRHASLATLGFDAVVTVVWRSGRIASTVVLGATGIPSERQHVVDGVTYIAPQRIEPWIGLGVALLVL